MQYDFDKIVDRRDTDSYKWDGNDSQFGRPGLLPFWVADMDFPTAKSIIEAMRKRLDHPIFGYSIRSEGYYQSIVHWINKRHSWEIIKDWLAFSAPGVIQAINLLIGILSKPGDEIILQMPAYKPLINVVTKNGRTLIKNNLKRIDGHYTMDFDDLKKKITNKTKLLILCSPHNPTGRVWTYQELTELAVICIRHNITVISDEIHADFVYPGNKHIPFGSLSNEAAMHSINCISASKTFNISGLQLATLIIPNTNIRKKFNERLDTAQINLGNIFGEVALEAAYTYCEDWLDQVIDYTKGNLDLLVAYIKENIPKIIVNKPQGTYLVWLDMRGLKKSSDEINDLLIKKAGIALYEGKEFGEERDGFFRMNIACPRSILTEGLEKMKQALVW